MAKFKVGDKVRHNGGASGVVGGTGVIIEQGSQNDKVYKVKWDRSSDSARYGDKWMPQELLDKVANSRVCNSSNPVVRKAANSATSKFKKGDIVLDRNGEWYQVKDIRGDGFIAIRRQSGSWEYRDPKDFKLMNSRAINSTNSVVAKALNAAREVTATNVRWRIITKMLSGPLFPYGDETYATKAEAEKRAEELRRAGSRSMRSYFVEEVDNSKALNAVATNVKSYPFYVVDKAMKGKCIFSGRYELSDANDDVAELKKSGVESKAVPRRVLIMGGIDPDEESSWKKNHKKD